MNRQVVACATGAMLLAGLGGWPSQAFSQGPMAPRPPDVRVAPPPAAPPPVVVPTPPMAPTMAPTMAPVPAAPPPAARTPTAGPAGGPPPFTDAQTKALPGIDIGLRGPGGTRQVTSDANGVVSLGTLRQGRHELSIDQKTLRSANGNQPAVIGLLLPAVQSVREGARRFVSVVVTPVNDAPFLVKVDVDARGQVSGVVWGIGGISVAVGDVNGDGRADLKVFEDLAQRNPSGETRLAIVGPRTGSTPAVTGGGPVRSAGAGFADGLAKLPNVGVTATGPGGVMQMRSDSQGVAPLGKLPIGNTTVEFNGSTLRSAGGTTPTSPGEPARLGDCCAVVAILALRADGQPVVSIWNGRTLPDKLPALLRVGRDGNLMDVDWGNGPQPVQPFTKVGAGTLSMTGAGGTVPGSPALLKLLQDRASKMTPGLVEANSALQEVSTTR